MSVVHWLLKALDRNRTFAGFRVSALQIQTSRANTTVTISLPGF